MKTIRIDDDVWKVLQKRAMAFEDTPNTVLRKILRLEKQAKQRNMNARSERGLRTPQPAFREPILKALYELGGSGRVQEVLSRIEKIMAKSLNDIDRQILGEAKMSRWSKAAQWERIVMVDDGLLKKGSPRGLWELTDRGIKLAEKAIENK